jgi:hypothetical protein
VAAPQIIHTGIETSEVAPRGFCLGTSGSTLGKDTLKVVLFCGWKVYLACIL